MSARVVECLTLDVGLAIIDFVVLQEGGAGGIDLYFEWNFELTTIAQDGAVYGGQATGAHVLIETFAPLNRLFGAVGELHDVAFFCAPVAAAGTVPGFEHRDFVA